MLEGAPPSVAKSWARGRGVDDQALGHSPGAVRPGGTPVGDYDPNTWAEAGLVVQIGALSRMQGRHPEEAALLGGDVVERAPVLEPGINDTRLVRLSTGVTGFHKSFAGTDRGAARWRGHSGTLGPLHECAAWRVADGLGPPWADMVPPCVLRSCDGELGSLSKAAPGLPPYPPRWPDPPRWPAQSAVDAGAFFDALTGQIDRYSNNMLLDGDRLTLIDHGFAFEKTGASPGASMLQRERLAKGREALSGAELGALDRLLASRDSFGLSQFMEPDRVFALRGRAARMRSTGRLLERGDI